jgi:hypothetical protein
MGNPFYNVVFRSWHPDIKIFAKAFTGIIRTESTQGRPSSLEIEAA